MILAQVSCKIRLKSHLSNQLVSDKFCRLHVDFRVIAMPMIIMMMSEPEGLRYLHFLQIEVRQVDQCNTNFMGWTQIKVVHASSHLLCLWS